MSARSIRITIGTIVVAAAVIFGINSLRLALDALQAGNVVRKDLLQDYLAAVAISEGADPYAPIPELNDKYGPPSDRAYFPHPTPHTPFSLLLLVPFASLPYPVFAGLWLVWEVIALTLGVAILWKEIAPDSFRLRRFLPCVLLVLGARPISSSLVLGQWSISVFLVSTLFFVAFLRGKQLLAGTALGLLLCLKLFGLPILLLLLYARKFVTIAVAACSAVFVHLVTMLFIGWTPISVYYREVVPNAAHGYHADHNNLSLWTVGQRLFAGLSPGVQDALTVPPLVSAPALVTPLALLLMGLLVIWLLRVFDNTKDYQVAIGGFFIVTALASPLAWLHGFSVSLVALAICWSRCLENRARLSEVLILSTVTLLWYVGELLITPVVGGRTSVTFARSLVAWMPIAAELLLLVLLSHFAARRPAGDPGGSHA